MKRVQRSEILDYVTYAERRDESRARVMGIKAVRRVHVGEWLTFLFENTDTMRDQIQEMVRIERIVREADVQHELDTYNELLGARGELGCTLLIEIEDASERDRKLVQWIELMPHLYARLADGRRIRASFDARQQGRGRLSTVQYLKFDTAGAVPVALGSDLPELSVESALSTATRAALAADLAG